MECPHCQKEIFEQSCPECGEMVPSEGQYCMHCGTVLESEKEAFHQEEDFDIENRVLCEDGTCTGIVVNGKCTECGKATKKP